MQQNDDYDYGYEYDDDFKPVEKPKPKQPRNTFDRRFHINHRRNGVSSFPNGMPCPDCDYEARLMAVPKRQAKNSAPVMITDIMSQAQVIKHINDISMPDADCSWVY